MSSNPQKSAAVGPTSAPRRPPSPPRLAAKPSLFVAHTLVIALQDATDNLRHTTTVANTAVGVALSRYLATGQSEYLQAIAPAHDSIKNASQTLDAIAKDTLQVLRNLATDADEKTGEEPTP